MRRRVLFVFLFFNFADCLTVVVAICLQQKLSTLKHENHIQFIEYFEDENTLYLVMELCTGGELFDQMVERGVYSEYDAASVR